MLLCAVLAASILVGGPPQRDDQVWIEMLKNVGLAPDTAQLSPTRWKGGGTYGLPMFDNLWNDWRGIDRTAIGLGRSCLRAAGSCEGLGIEGAKALGVKVDAARPAPVPAGDLVQAIARLDPKAATSDVREQAGRVPRVVARAAEIVLQGAAEAKLDLDAVYSELGGAAKVKAVADQVAAFGTDYDLGPDMPALMGHFNGARMLTGYLKLAIAVDKATTLMRHAPKTRFHFRCDTVLGRIALNGIDDDTYADVPYLLILDTGGNDRYFGGAAASPANPISVLIDAGGNDVFEAKSRAFGFGLLGYGILVDMGGNGRYKVETAGLGAGIFGVGVLLGEAGNDHYEIRRFGEGAAVFGLGLLSELRGRNRYDCFMEAQGFGGTHGFGALVEVAGDNQYVADDSKIDYPSPQSAQHNTSLAQGCGFGRRADPGDGHSLAGGIGLLVDGGGGNRYKCGVFGQGVAYWYALGFLVGFGGNDRFEGAWYVQGASAHYAVGAMCELKGGDTCVASITQSQGHGRDYSIGWLHVRGGDDRFECPGTALGSSNMNGIGVFWHEHGRGTYLTGAESLGFAGESRPGELCLGLFRADGSLNTFPPGLRAKQNSAWAQPGSDKNLCKGSGVCR